MKEAAISTGLYKNVVKNVSHLPYKKSANEIVHFVKDQRQQADIVPNRETDIFDKYSVLRGLNDLENDSVIHVEGEMYYVTDVYTSEDNSNGAKSNMVAKVKKLSGNERSRAHKRMKDQWRTEDLHLD